MNKLVFATNNAHKLEEIRQILGDDFDILSLKDIHFFDEIPEERDTLEGNASQKAFHIYDRFHINCFADDTGLEIEALDGRPGVYSARYAGPGCSFEDNMNKVLREMEGQSKRKACFRTVISLIVDGKEVQFEGRVDGHISTERKGSQGFGYDPIFVPEGYEQSFAEMDAATKNAISHRGRAVQKLVKYLKG